VRQRRLQVDTRKWILSKMPRKFGDRIEIGGDPDAPLVTKIELVAVSEAGAGDDRHDRRHADRHDQ
jgi:hypothetical protein